jgi:uncharacterized protein
MENSITSTLRRNNLDKSSSPYLLQHTGNPIWWQEWSEDLIRYAKEVNKPLFVSVGYATCHWCHVMAAEAFSDQGTADYLNEHFISIKIDREQRPDIDQFMMDFINKQDGRGGWPLNVFLTPALHPVFALTYAPAGEHDSKYSFLSIAKQVYEYFEKNSDKIQPFIPGENRPPAADEHSIIKILSRYYDPHNGGFGINQKFPSHTTLLYLLYQLSIGESPTIENICTRTLDVMSLRGLNDHLQGGIYRYCTDNEWTIPHFEKMLYDQAMALWVYSLAFKIIGKQQYKRMAEGILRCLAETFESDGLYISAHDADTEHEEGLTYLWSYHELSEVLTPEEFIRFTGTYYITETGNFEGMNHLIRKNSIQLDDIEEKLLALRKSRKQPSSDDKILSGVNALVAIGFIQAGRLLDNASLEEKAARLVQNIISKFWDGSSLGHSLYKGMIQKQAFLFDAAALLTAISMLCEKDATWISLKDEVEKLVESFKEGERWTESKAEDFKTVYASWFDHPIPSSVSLALTGLARSSLVSGKDLPLIKYQQPFQCDFYNINAMIHNGLFHVYTTIKYIDWTLLPANSVQIRGEHEQDCFMGVCSPLSF